MAVGSTAGFQVKSGAVRVVADSPAKDKVMGTIKKGIVYFTFDVKGDWSIDVYDENGAMVEWIRINVY